MPPYTLLLLILLFSTLSGCENASTENKQNNAAKSGPVAPQSLPVDIKNEIAPKPLDLSLPPNIPQTLSADPALSQKKPDYLPNLFKDKTSTVDIEAITIKKHEEESEKVKVVDGVGIEFKLSH
jgi:PBP1b-binding outer membrane lipoprotein LpoB